MPFAKGSPVSTAFEVVRENVNKHEGKAYLLGTLSLDF